MKSVSGFTRKRLVIKNEEQQQELTTAQEPSVWSGIRMKVLTSATQGKMKLGSHLPIEVPTKRQRAGTAQSEGHFTLLKSSTESLPSAVTAPSPQHPLALVCSQKKNLNFHKEETLGL